MSRPTHQPLETLVDFLEQNPGIAKGLLRTAHAKQQTKRKWDEIAVSLNSLGGAQKDGKGWAKYRADKKFALKKICAQHAQSMRRTGGGTAENLPALTPIDQRLVAVILLQDTAMLLPIHFHPQNPRKEKGRGQKKISLKQKALMNSKDSENNSFGTYVGQKLEQIDPVPPFLVTYPDTTYFPNNSTNCFLLLKLLC
ncbi:hypothetical protein PYW07_006597 [Mythimna separata]|uniref:Regulatory protein zeste n=1 Tax=Mythimna separata TaxID=271217 RepID=A0AAD8DXM7_MYTSE|nr:hypothetical protein PYW07_006597 [Mythimna separata]